jgi:hypothetical protein
MTGRQPDPCAALDRDHHRRLLFASAFISAGGRVPPAGLSKDLLGRMMAARLQERAFGGHGARVKLYSRPGNNLTNRFSLIVEALARLRSRSCIIDGEAVACDERGVAAFDLIRYRRNDDCVFLYAFDLIELNGDDPLRDPHVVRKATLASVLAKGRSAFGSTSTMELDDGEVVFYHASPGAIFRSGPDSPGTGRAHDG